MENKIPTASEFFKEKAKNKGTTLNVIDLIEEYSKLYSEFQLQSLTDEIKEKAKIKTTYVGEFVDEVEIDKQSIQTITDNFIKQLK